MTGKVPEDGAVGPRPWRLSGQQQEVYDILTQRSPRLANVYTGAVMVLGQGDNPDRLALAAHGARELIEKLPELAGIAVKQRQNLRERVNDIEPLWRTAVERPKCRGKKPWGGKISRTLSKFLHEAEAFVEWYAREVPTRRAELASVVQAFDRFGIAQSAVLQEKVVDGLMRIKKYFNNVCHHRQDTDDNEFLDFLGRVERFLLVRLRRRAFADLDVIDAIIREGEGRA